jgi:hypothetical protein
MVHTHLPTVHFSSTAGSYGRTGCGRPTARAQGCAGCDQARDDCHKWAKAQAELFVEESRAVQQVVKQLMATHHNPAKPLKGYNADPFVIAMAKDGGPNWVVVSDEHAGSQASRKMPFVCAHEKIACINFQGLMKAEGCQFR